MRLLGVDPGKNGAAVVLDTKEPLGWFYKFRFHFDGLLDKESFKWFVEDHHIDMILLEKVQGRGNWAATNNFNFGAVFGQTWLAVSCLKKPYLLVRPQQWQKKIHEGIEGKLSPKEKSACAYRNLFPHKPLPAGPRGGGVHDGVLDALLIAYYGVIKQKKQLLPWIIEEWTY